MKGTEYFDAKKKGYIDYPITDVLQMMGRAGRIQFSDRGVAKIFVEDRKKDFYKRFLHEPFPVESSLHKCLHDHLNAEIVAGTISNIDDTMKFLSYTYFYKRLRMVSLIQPKIRTLLTMEHLILLMKIYQSFLIFWFKIRWICCRIMIV